VCRARSAKSGPGEVVKISNGVEDEDGPAVAIKFMHPLILRVRAFDFLYGSRKAVRTKLCHVTARRGNL